MVRNIIFTFIIFDLFLALSIVIIWEANGVSPHAIRLGTNLLSFFNSIALEVERETITWAIPHLPEAGYVHQTGFPNFILDLIIYVWNSFVNFINVLYFLLNSIIKAIMFYRTLLIHFTDLISLLADL